MSTNQPDIAGFQRAIANSLHEHWRLYLVEGIVLLILGAAAIALPPLATLAFTVILGWLFLLSGVMGLITTFWMRQAPGFWWSLISAALGIVVGGLLLARPIRAFSEKTESRDSPAGTNRIQGSCWNGGQHGWRNRIRRICVRALLGRDRMALPSRKLRSNLE